MGWRWLARVAKIRQANAIKVKAAMKDRSYVSSKSLESFTSFEIVRRFKRSQSFPSFKSFKNYQNC